MRDKNIFPMNIYLVIFFFSFFFSCKPRKKNDSKPNVVYGIDSRSDYKSWSGKEKEWAKAAAVIVKENSISKIDDKFSHIETESIELCEGEKFKDQPKLGYCSGFVANEKDIVVLSGHCNQTQIECDSMRIVFNMHNDKIVLDRSSGRIKISNSDIYRCKHFIFQEQKSIAVSTEIQKRTDDLVYVEDFAVLKMDRKNEASTLIKIDNSNDYKKGTSLTMIGSPSGLPLKISKGEIVSNSSDFVFETDLDAFGGNSGSMIIDTDKEAIIGILTSGERDYLLDEKKKCYRTRVCPKVSGNRNKECRGEQGTKSSVFEKHLRGIQQLNLIRKKIADPQNFNTNIPAVAEMALEIENVTKGLFYMSTGKGGVVRLYNSDPILLDVFQSDHFFWLDKKNYYISLQNRGNWNLNVSLKDYSKADFERIQLSEKKTTKKLNISGGQKIRFEITSKQPGDYLIYSIGIVDTIATIHDIFDGDRRQSDDIDLEKNLNFELRLLIDVNKKYFLEIASFLDLNSKGDFQLIFEKIGN